MVHGIDGERLNVVLQRLRDRDEPSRVVSEELRPTFDKDAAGRRGADQDLGRGAGALAEASLIDFIMPLIWDPGIFDDLETIRLLEYLRDDLLPDISENEEVAHLATKVIDDEIARHNFVRERRHAGITA
jgi:hypothetical protein